MKIFLTILTDCYPQSAFLIKVPLSSAIKSETVEKGEEGSESYGGGLQKGSKMGVLYLGCISVGIYG